jgi:hypothetical protein
MLSTLFITLRDRPADPADHVVSRA